MTGYVRVAAAAARAAGGRLFRASLISLSVVLAAAVAAGAATRPVVAAEATAAAHVPEQVVAAFHAALVRAMRDSVYQERYDALAPAMNRAFDFESMTRIAVGPSWFNLQAAQRAALVDAFRRFS